MKKIVFLVSLCFGTLLNCIAQEGLDDIFDDGDNNSSIDISVGTDLITTIGGTFNVYSELHFKQSLGVQFGLGVIPFGYLMDFSNPGEILEGGDDQFNRNINKGFYYNIGFKYIKSMGDAFSYYYYGEFKRWSYTEALSLVTEETIKGIRTKVNFGIGYSLMPFDNIGFDAHTGIFLGSNKKEDNDNITISKSPAIGFDFGLGAFYRF